jgi:hypothetical protein
MRRSEANTHHEEASRNERFLTRSGVREERRSCLVCGAGIGSGGPTIQNRARVRMRCAVWVRRLVRR